MDKRFGSVSELVTALSDKPFKKRFDEESSKKSLGRALFKLRNSQGLTQEQVAEKINIPQSAISRIEHSANDKIRFDDLENYVSALGYKISVSIHPDRNAVQWVKYHAFEIRKHLHQLADLCNGDTEIEGEVAKFFREVTYNMLKIIDDSASKLTNVPLPPKSETLEVITAIPELQPPPQEQPKSETTPVG